MLIYKYLRGSHLYGLSTPMSDEDYGGVYITPIDSLLGLRNRYKEQENISGNDIVYYELGRYIELLLKSNPNMIESLFVPSHLQTIKPHNCLDILFENREKFITKELVKILIQYAHSQIQKAQGLNKMIVSPVDDNKTILDFCYTFNKQGSQPILKWLEERSLLPRYCGLVNIPHMLNIYGLYYDWAAHYKENARIADIWAEAKTKEIIYGYRGIVNDDNSSKEVRLSSVEKDIEPLCYMSYNQAGYSKYCVDLKNYKEWVAKRNPERYRINTEHGKNYDSKNCCQCMRLLHMAQEIIDGKGFLIDRTDIDRNYLLSIKRGDMEFQDFLDEANSIKTYVENTYQRSNLPEKVDEDYFNDILIDIRKHYL